MSLLGTASKNKLFFQFPIRKFNVFFQLSSDRYKS